LTGGGGTGSAASNFSDSALFVLGEVFGGNGSIFIGDMNGLVGGFVGVDPDVALVNVALFIYPLFKFVGVALAVDVSVDLVDVFILIGAGLCFMGFVVLGP
jgi:hypothetical protein